MEALLFITELIGTIAFAASGAMMGVERRLDLFGVVALGATTALGGGLVRDIVLGHLPPRMFYNPLYISLALGASIIVFMLSLVRRPRTEKREALAASVFNLLDALGLGAFAVIGCGFAVEAGFGERIFLTVFLGMITGVGGGVLRDILVTNVPAILKKHIYATAALAGSATYYLLYALELNKALIISVPVLATVLIRAAASYFKLNLPRPPD